MEDKQWINIVKKRIDISDGAFHNDDSGSMQLTIVGEWHEEKEFL